MDWDCCFKMRLSNKAFIIKENLLNNYGAEGDFDRKNYLPKDSSDYFGKNSSSNHR